MELWGQMGKGGGSEKDSRIERMLGVTHLGPLQRPRWGQFLRYFIPVPNTSQNQSAGRQAPSCLEQENDFIPPHPPAQVSALFFDLFIGNQPPPPTKTWKHETPPW